MNKIIKQYPMTDRLIVRRGYFSLSYMWGLPFYSHMENTLLDCIFSLRGEVWAKKKLVNPNTFYWSACTKPGKWDVIYMCVRVLTLYLFLQFLIRFWNCSASSLVFFVFIYLIKLLDSLVLVGRVATNKQPKIGGWSYVIKI